MDECGGMAYNTHVPSGVDQTTTPRDYRPPLARTALTPARENAPTSVLHPSRASGSAQTKVGVALPAPAQHPKICVHVVGSLILPRPPHPDTHTHATLTGVPADTYTWTLSRAAALHRLSMTPGQTSDTMQHTAQMTHTHTSTFSPMPASL